MTGPALPRWCTTCEVHRATAGRPVCLDEQRREEKK